MLFDRPLNSLPKYLRLVRGGRIQVRIPLDPNGAVRLNLGSYATVEEALRVRNEYVRTGIRPAHLLPRWVRFVEGATGRVPPGYYYDVRVPGCVRFAGPYATAEKAHAGAKRWLRKRLQRTMLDAYLVT